MNVTKGARVYRFHDLVALSFKTADGYMETIYLDPDVAFGLGMVFDSIHLDINVIAKKFSKSEFGTHIVKQVADDTETVPWNAVTEKE